jgi:hydroxyacylglutathione hydrolase
MVHLPGVRHVYLGKLPEELSGMPEEGTIVTLCGSGQRALIAASVLKNEGHNDVRNCFGSMAACAAVGCELEKGAS